MGACCCSSRNQDYVEQLLDDNKLSIYVVTWNMAGCSPTEPDSLQSLVTHNRISQCDIYIVALQEVVELNASNMFRKDDSKIDRVWRGGIIKALGDEFCFIESVRLMGLLLLIFSKSQLQHEITNIRCNTVGAGIFGVGGNKGAVGIKFDLFETSMCFVCCHLASGKQHAAKRNEDICKIMRRLTFASNEHKQHEAIDEQPQNGNADDELPPEAQPMLMEKISNTFSSVLNGKEKPRGSTIDEHDVIIFCGDMNYRLEFETLEQVHKLIAKRKWRKLLAGDQLLREKKAGNIFQGFKENAINFAPSYKYIPTTNVYDKVKKKRMPAWCDRILYKSQNNKQLKCLRYDSINDQIVSDHKPVFALFEFEW